MSWRTIVVRTQSKLSYKNGYMLVRTEETKMIHLSEIGVLILETTAVTITNYLLMELIKKKINVIFCDEKRNPSAQLIPFQGNHNSSETIRNQVDWTEEKKDLLWQNITKQKIINQANVLLSQGMKSAYGKLLLYAEEVQPNDSTNREAIAAKMYFSALFGVSFIRHDICNTNSALNYGYTILLSAFNREISAKGYLSQIGLHHKNRFNPFNLSSDLMEPYRTLVDEVVISNRNRELDNDYKAELVDILNQKIFIKNSNQFVTNGISIYVNSVIQSMSSDNSISVDHFSTEI